MKSDDSMLTDIVKSISFVLVSDPLVIAPILISAKNSGKLRRHKARKLCSPSRGSFLSETWSDPLRDSKSSQLRWSDNRPSNADSARKLNLCRDFLTRAMSCVRTKLNSLRIGSMSVPNADATI